ncbi:hypothetical protein [Nocardioides sp. CFH 31398]|uniref:hypothetical protein n=1 Tax=Nocardioides sp. CFH 31398 TaxID=2919579 RepID=UPI001F051923|nr:hypothetical protein [Nocardioides sp. CFH 31398]MCH1868797.1 hypothetical protein [Nocardioides sp. CFH 31398]
MTQTPDEQGRLDDEALEQETSDDEGAAAAGEYDPAQGSPGAEQPAGHPVGEDFPDEAVRYDDPEERPRS